MMKGRGMAITLTAVYDLAVSPLTFDFAYAVVQAEVERRRRGCERLALHIQLKAGATTTDDPLDDDQWRLRHVLAPLSQMLKRPSELYIGRATACGPEILMRPHGLHWLSDVLALAEAGEEVQVLTADLRTKTAISQRLHGFLQGRRLITITLREARYQLPRNSNLIAWAALARSLASEGYAVIVLRDHERADAPLPGDWGGAITLPKAVWSLRWRAALYELAWLNLSVNNGPAFMAIFNAKTRFLIFKMLGGTPETTAQHCRRLGFAPGGTLSFLNRHQQLVWDIDEVGVLHERTFAALAEIERHPNLAGPVPPAAPVAECIVAAARRDYRSGLPAADHLGRIPAGPLRSAVAVERATMLLDEERPIAAARALADAPKGAMRSAIAAAIAHAEPEPKVIELLSPLMKGDPTADWQAALRRVKVRSEAVTSSQVQTLPIANVLVLAADGLTGLRNGLHLLAAAERERRHRDFDTLHLVIVGGDECWLEATALFPTISTVTMLPERAIPASATSSCESFDDVWPTLAKVPARAKALFRAWALLQGIEDGRYAVIAPIWTSDLGLWSRVAQELEAWGLVSINWAQLASVWPLEMLAALLEAAALRVIGDPVPVILSEILGLDAADPNLLVADSV